MYLFIYRERDYIYIYIYTYIHTYITPRAARRGAPPRYGLRAPERLLRGPAAGYYSIS